MVTKYGMSERIGLATYGDRAPLFLRQTGGGDRDYSDATARAIDEEVRTILDRIHDRAHGLLTTRKAALIAAAAELKRVETLEGDHLRRLLAGEPVASQT
jgi:cell division protease FtsH